MTASKKEKNKSVASEHPKNEDTTEARENVKLETDKSETSSKLLQLPRAWIILATIRLLVNIFGQRSYIHPDEFFQGNSLPDMRSKNKLGIGWHPNFEGT